VKTPESNDVRAQLQRLYRYERFRGEKLRKILEYLVEQWLLDRGANLTGKTIGQAMGEKAVFEEESNKDGYPKTRANLKHVRNRLESYNETAGYCDPVIIKLNAGSYVPVIEYNPRVTGGPALDPESERLILRAKTAIDARTLRGAMRALDYYGPVS
jgi:hypothetical protein